jgi:hypothetical protein
MPRPTALPWNTGTVRELLRNPVYVGDIVWNRETSARCVRLLDGALSGKLAMHKSRTSGRRIAWARNDPKDHIVLRDRHEPIISREDFAAAQAVFEERAKRHLDEEGLAPTRRSFALGGQLFCGKCDTGMFSRTATVKGRVYRYYYCGERNHACRVRADVLEQAVLTELRRLLRAPAAAKRGAKDALGEAKSPAKLLEDLEAALEGNDRVRAKGVFLLLLERVTVHAPRGRPPAQRHGVARPWRVRLVPSAQVAGRLAGKPREIVLGQG